MVFFLVVVVLCLVGSLGGVFFAVGFWDAGMPCSELERWRAKILRGWLIGTFLPVAALHGLSVLLDELFDLTLRTRSYRANNMKFLLK